MNPSNDQAAETPVPLAPEFGNQPATDQVAPAVSGAVSGPQAPQAVPIPIIPLPTVSNQTTVTGNQTSGFQTADDKDVIEPEWVHKAKSIVRTTSDDPYKQSEDLTTLKADYMQKRYNKIVKLK